MMQHKIFAILPFLMALILIGISNAQTVSISSPPTIYYNGTPSTITFNITSNPNNATFSLWLSINGSAYTFLGNTTTSISNSQTNIGTYQYVFNSTNETYSYMYSILPTPPSGGNATDLYTASVLGLGIFAFVLLYLGYQGRDSKVFSFLFIVLGLLALYGMVNIMGSYTLGYTVPANNTLPYYNSAIYSLANLIYAYSYLIIVALLFYIGIFIILYIKDMLLAAKNRKQAKLDYNAEV